MRSTGWDTEGRAGPTEEGYMCEVQAGGTALGQGAVCNGCHQCRGKVGRKIGPSREGREEKHSKISVWFIEDSHKTWSDKGFTMALMWGDHLEQLSHSNLSLPSLNHDTGHHQEKAKASHTVLGPYSCHHGHAPCHPDLQICIAPMPHWVPSSTRYSYL